jgi:DNA-binding MarR family transcriptional regulator
MPRVMTPSASPKMRFLGIRVTVAAGLPANRRNDRLRPGCPPDVIRPHPTLSSVIRRHPARNKSVRLLIMQSVKMMPVSIGAAGIRRAEERLMVTPEEVGERYLAVHHRMLRAVNGEMSACGLSLARTKVMTRLHEHGPVRQNVLAADLGLSPHSITDIVDGLERQGLAERLPDPTDRRAKLVAITKAGRSCLTIAHATRERLLRQIFGTLTEEDRATFLRLLDTLDEAASPLADSSDTATLGV